MNIDPLSPATGFKLGDKVTIPLRDQRTWWQRHAPRWLGGRSAGHPYGEFVITEVYASGKEITE